MRLNCVTSSLNGSTKGNISKPELGSFDLDRKNAQIAINEAIKKIEELS